jgi:CHRD domain
MTSHRRIFMALACASLFSLSLQTYAAEPKMVMASLDATQEVPPNDSRAQAELSGQFDPDTRTLTYQVIYTGLSGPVKMGHFHGPAPSGQNAGVTLPFTPPLDSPIAGTAVLTPEQAQALLSGQWYVNLHTAAHPSGEVRGQVMVH